MGYIYIAFTIFLWIFQKAKDLHYFHSEGGWEVVLINPATSQSANRTLGM